MVSLIFSKLKSQDTLNHSIDSVFLKSAWGGTVYLPDEVPVLVEFAKDTLFFYINAELVETMHYKKVDSSRFQLRKINGASPCDDEIAEYDLILSEDKKILSFKAVKDKCVPRAMGLGNNNKFNRL